mgnify:CR=1 FL=1
MYLCIWKMKKKQKTEKEEEIEYQKKQRIVFGKKKK